MDRYNVLLKDYGNGRKKIVVYDKCIINLDNEEKQFYALKDKCDIDGVIKEEQQATDYEISDTDETDRLLKRIENNNRAKMKIYDYAMSNDWDWFFTLTFSLKKVDRENYTECKKKLQKWLENIKERYAPNLKFLFIPELHKDKKSWHFHGLVSNMTNVKFEMAVDPKDGNIIIHKGKVVFNCKNWRFGYSECTRIKDSQRASNYITKYVTKSNMALIEGENRYICSRNLNKPIETKYCILEDSEVLECNIGKVFNELSLMHLYNTDDVIYEKTKEFEYNGVKQKIKYIEIQEKVNCFIPATSAEQKIFER